MISGSVQLTSRIPLMARLMEDRLAKVLAQTGEDLAAATRANMYPGHAFLTGYMQSMTTWKTTGKLSGLVSVDTDYAAYVEYGTSRAAPRPFLTPAIASDWPKRLYLHAVRMDVGLVL